uniref:Predicted protein n=1 Tax=Hordeum vulgare subsp. vulgare TaxID=112509 RepID=F2E460_HORVV|nr:predicted protein [Hordeum vulgare subsp. vulgare]
MKVNFYLCPYLCCIIHIKFCLNNIIFALFQAITGNYPHVSYCIYNLEEDAAAPLVIYGAVKKIVSC